MSEAVREATAIADPTGADTAAGALYDAFEDDDRPASAANMRRDLLGTVRAIDPEEDEPAAWAAVAAAIWLARHPGQEDKGDHVIREGVRLVFAAKPFPALAQWLDRRGIVI